MRENLFAGFYVKRPKCIQSLPPSFPPSVSLCLPLSLPPSVSLSPSVSLMQAEYKPASGEAPSVSRTDDITAKIKQAPYK